MSDLPVDNRRISRLLQTGRSLGNWSNPYFKKLFLRNPILQTFVILKHDIIATNRACTTVNNSILRDLACLIAALDGLKKEVNRFFTQVVVILDSSVVTSLSIEFF